MGRVAMIEEPETGRWSSGRPTSDPERVAGWWVFRYGVVASTNDLARTLAPWTAVVAEEQRAGRGQWGRSFVSDRGGLYVSAVVPTPGASEGWWVGLAVAAGWSVARALRDLGVRGVRLRWPNDVMVGAAKLGGILVEQTAPGAAVVGVGLNVRNVPWQEAPELLGVAARLEDHADEVPSEERLLERVLCALRHAQGAMQGGGLRSLAASINEDWGVARPVEVDVGADRVVRGEFAGIDEAGRVRLRVGAAGEQVVEPHRIRRLVELPWGGEFSSDS